MINRIIILNDEQEDNWFDIITWLEQNSIQWSYTFDHVRFSTSLLFEREEDAVHFKLVWS